MPRVLVVDDSPTDRLLVSEILALATPHDQAAATHASTFTIRRTNVNVWAPEARFRPTSRESASQTSEVRASDSR